MRVDAAEMKIIGIDHATQRSHAQMKRMRIRTADGHHPTPAGSSSSHFRSVAAIGAWATSDGKEGVEQRHEASSGPAFSVRSVRSTAQCR